MKGNRRFRPSPAMVIACTALIFAMTSAGYAAGVLPRNSVGTKHLKRNAVTSAKVMNGSLQALDLKAGTLPKGAQWATVNSAGTIVRQSGGITAKRVQAGGYVVTFPEEVTNRLILVTPALANDLTTRGAAIAAPCVDFVASCGVATIANSVTVFTSSTAGSQQDHSFTVAQMGPSSATAPVSPRGAARSKKLDLGE